MQNDDSTDAVAPTARQLTAAKRLRVAARLVLVALAVLQAWADRYAMNPDGISYLDMSRAVAAGHWAETINGYWSPLYSWLIGPIMRVTQLSAYWDFTLAHAVNFIIFLIALLGFEFFLRAFAHHERLSGPYWLKPFLTYAAFGWAMLVWIGLDKVTPDIAVAAAVFFASGFAVRIATQRAVTFDFIGLGAALGAGYLAKGAMLPLAAAFIVPVTWLTRHRLRRAALVVATFAVIAVPFMIALSTKVGHPTTGEVAKLNYAWFVSGVRVYKHWRGDPPETGIPVHATRKILDNPPTYEFARPIGGTYPVWYDPAYWHEGMKIPIEPRMQLQRFLAEVQQLPWMFADLFVATVAMLVLVLRRQVRVQRNLALVVATPLLFALLIYSIVHVEPRFLGGFVGVMLAGTLVIFEPRGAGGREAYVAILVAVGVLLSARIVQAAAEDGRTLVQQAEAGPRSHAQWIMARDVERAGVQTGDTVAYIGDSFRAYWAYLGRYKIGAEVSASRFWTSPPNERARALRALSRRGITTVLSDARFGCNAAEGWVYVSDTQLCMFHGVARTHGDD